MARMVDVDALIKAMGVHTYMQTEWTPATAWGVPIVDAEPVKHGHWMPTTVSSGRDSWKCSVCGRRARGKLKNLPYCHCGAKMDEVEEDADE